MSGGLSFCQGANQSLRVLGIGDQNDVELNQTIARLKEVGLLEKDVYFASRFELGKFLRGKKEEFKANASLFSKEQQAALDQGLQDILGDSLYS